VWWHLRPFGCLNLRASALSVSAFRHHISTRRMPGNVESAGFFNCQGRKARLSVRSKLAPETESVAASLKSSENRAVTGVSCALATAHPVIAAGATLERTHKSLMGNPLIRNHTFGTGTQRDIHRGPNVTRPTVR